MGIRSKITALLDVLDKGKSVANVEAWKSGQVTVNILVGLLGSLVGVIRAFGIDVPVTDDQLFTIASAILGLLGVYNSFVTVATTDKIGLK